MKLLLILLVFSSSSFAGIRKECRKSAREYCAGLSGKQKRQCKRNYRRNCRKNAHDGKQLIGSVDNCGFNYSSPYPSNGKTCVIQHTSSTIKPEKKFYTNCSTCLEGSLRRHQNKTSIESPIYQVSMLICQGNPKVGDEITSQYSFKVTNSQTNKADYFTYNKSQCSH